MLLTVPVQVDLFLADVLRDGLVVGDGVLVDAYTLDGHGVLPVQREELRVESEPITDANVDTATQGPAISEDEHEVTLSRGAPRVAVIDAALENVCEAVREATAQGDSRRERECRKLVDSWLDRRNQLAGTASSP